MPRTASSLFYQIFLTFQAHTFHWIILPQRFYRIFWILHSCSPPVKFEIRSPILTPIFCGPTHKAAVTDVFVGLFRVGLQCKASRLDA